MKSDWFGDSYDIVKRFFCAALNELGYTIEINPMFTGDNAHIWDAYQKLIRPAPKEKTTALAKHTALFVDPDTGIAQEKKPPKHVSIDELIDYVGKFDLVFAFDQSFNRGQSAKAQMEKKLGWLQAKGARGLYYDSHAKFLFVSAIPSKLDELRVHLRSLGLPDSRLLFLGETTCV